MGTTRSIFLRVIETQAEDKGLAIKSMIRDVNRGRHPEGAFLTEARVFRKVSGIPFSYWAPGSHLDLFEELPAFEGEGRLTRIGLSTKDDFRFLRLRWEVNETSLGHRWFSLAKGGSYSPYYCDLHLLINWENDGQELKAFLDRRTKELFGRSGWSRWINSWEYYFRPGFTWPRRTSYFSVRVLPRDCIFSDKGPAGFVNDDDHDRLLALISVLNSKTFLDLLGLQLARTQLARSFEVGLIKNTPMPRIDERTRSQLAALGVEAWQRMKSFELGDETSNAFNLPQLLCVNHIDSIHEMSNLVQSKMADARHTLNRVVAQTDEIVAQDYGLGGELPRKDETTLISEDIEWSKVEVDPYDERRPSPYQEISIKDSTQDLFMWAVGTLFGRWDIRMAIDHDMIPESAGPFDPLPVCPPGGLVSRDGFPANADSIVSEAWLRARPNAITLPEKVDGPSTISDDEYPLKIAWDGVLVDDPDHPRDVVSAVRQVMLLVCPENAAEIEREACEILGFESLRAYFRDPRRGFFDFHIKRYSKSRRKAPIYWLLQTESRNYGIWLYYHRMTPDTLFHVAREYVDPKVALEENRLIELQSRLKDLSGTEQKSRERELADQAGVIEELKNFRKVIEDVAMLELKPDFDDGVILNIAPLWQLVAWKEAEKAWKQLLSGDYEWSTISQQLRARELIKARGK